jgi:hypothetical protein
MLDSLPIGLKARYRLRDLAIILFLAQKVEEAARVWVSGEALLDALLVEGKEQGSLRTDDVVGRPGLVLKEGLLTDDLSFAEHPNIDRALARLGDLRLDLAGSDDVEHILGVTLGNQLEGTVAIENLDRLKEKAELFAVEVAAEARLR